MTIITNTVHNKMCVEMIARHKTTQLTAAILNFRVKIMSKLKTSVRNEFTIPT